VLQVRILSEEKVTTPDVVLALTVVLKVPVGLSERLTV
jgi:hypothetical protein